jgi:hypothetical protein
MRYYLRYFPLLLLALASLSFNYAAPDSVDLGDFRVSFDPANEWVVIAWDTASEYDFSGFYVRRNTNSVGDFSRIQIRCDGIDTLFIQAKGLDGSGALYGCLDINITLGTTYYYRLEMVDTSSHSTFTDPPISTYAGETPTPTATNTTTTTSTSGTRTPTLTRTPTETRTVTITRTKTHRPSVTITRTPSPFHAVTFTSRPRPTSTLTDTPTSTPTPTISPTVTTTLAPLPSLTLLFPYHSPTPTSTPTSTATASPIPPSPTTTPKPDTHIPLRMSFLGGIIILLWITLAGFLFAYLRKITR